MDAVWVGADRIAANGDVANKIGTYLLAVLAKFHGIPFYVVARIPRLTRIARTVRLIPIEQRAASEVTGVAGSFGSVQWAPENAPVYNPAFDVTPAVAHQRLGAGYGRRYARRGCEREICLSPAIL